MLDCCLLRVSETLRGVDDWGVEGVEGLEERDLGGVETPHIMSVICDK